MRALRLSYGALVIAALLYGITFVVVKDAVAVFPPFAFVAWRFLLAGSVLLLASFPRSFGVWRDGTVAGLILFAGYAFQTGGLMYADASHSALITALYVVFTPPIVAVSKKRFPTIWTIFGTFTAFLGIALLTSDSLSFSWDSGTLLTLGCAVAFAAHIAFLSHTTHRHRVIQFTAVQLFTVSLGGVIGAVVFEGLPLPDPGIIPAILITGLGVSCLAFLLQVWAQKRIGANRTAVILTLEPLFGILSASLILGERFSPRGWCGAAVILVAIWIVLSKDFDSPSKEAEAIAPVG